MAQLARVQISLFSESFYQAQSAFELRKAVPVKAETDIHPPFIIPEIVCPHLCLFQEADVASAVAGVPGILPKVTNQKYLTQWYRETCPTRQDFIRLRQADPFIDTRLTHISPIQYTGPHKPFDLHHKITLPDGLGRSRQGSDPRPRRCQGPRGRRLG